MDLKAIQNTEPIQQMVQRLGADIVFGAPTSENGVTVIPVAQVEFGFGYGGGYGQNGSKGEADTTDTASQSAPNEGGGSGGGAGGRSTPRGFIRIAGDEVRFDPITDETRIPLAGIIMVAWVVFWVMATIRVLVRAVAKTRQVKAARASGKS